jgi:hypothetical protein
MAWSLSDFEKGVFGVLTVVADERKRREYLNRARGDASIVAISR